jgi:hypothetical protein
MDATTVKLLKRVKKYILEEPRRLEMNITGCAVDPREDNSNPPCGTVGCIAGWACVLGKGLEKASPAIRAQRMTWISGQELLHLSNEEAARLFTEPEASFYFDMMGWPQRFTKRYLDAVRPATRAKVTVERIDHFIKTHGEE